MSDKLLAPSPFWMFSLRFYGLPGVPPACLLLQDRGGVDVNVLLFALWAAKSGRAIATADALGFIDAMSAWKESVVVALRGVRRFLKEPPAVIADAGAQALRANVKAIELEAERLQQEALYARFPLAALGAYEDAKAAAKQNIAACEQAFGAPFDTGAVDALLQAFDKLGEA